MEVSPQKDLKRRQEITPDNDLRMLQVSPRKKASTHTSDSQKLGEARKQILLQNLGAEHCLIDTFI